LQGLILGLAIAAPVGPIGVFCIRQTLACGWIRGIACGLGAATAHGIYGCVAGFKLTFIANFLIEQQIWLRLIGGAFLCYLGVKNFIKVQIRPDNDVVKGDKMGAAYISTLLLTLSNPATILAFAAIFSGVDLTSLEGNYFSAMILVAGLFFGSGLWWFFLTSIISVVRSRFTVTGLKWVNRISGVVITAFGLIAIVSIKN
jgi:threonine/homoserine/homoserine lactone efflux protein